MRTAILFTLAATLAACGTKRDLEPAPPDTLPVAAYGASERATSAELLAAPTQGAPERSVELRRRSEERVEDPFDLPPDGDDEDSGGPG